MGRSGEQRKWESWRRGGVEAWEGVGNKLREAGGKEVGEELKDGLK